MSDILDAEKIINEEPQEKTENNSIESLKDKISKKQNERQKENGIVVYRHLGYKRKYLDRHPSIFKWIFYILLVIFVFYVITILMPYK